MGKRKSLLSLALAVVLLFSCAGFASLAEAPVEIDFLYVHGGAGGELMKTFCEEFTAQSGGKIVVNPMFVEGSYEGAIEKLQILSMSGQLPEVTQAGHHYTYFMAENMPVVPVEDFIAAEEFDTSDFFEAMMDLGKGPGGRQYGMPFAISIPILYYNQDMFEREGISGPPKTYDEMREIAKKLTHDDQFGIYIGYSITGNWEVQCMIENYGGQMIADDRKSVAMGDAGLKTFELLNALQNEDMSMPALSGVEGGMQGTQLWSAGKVGMFISTIAGLSGHLKDCQFTVLTAPHPDDGSGKRSVPAGGNCLYVLKSDEAREAASWAFMKFITAPEQNARVAQTMGYMTTSKRGVDDPALMGDYLNERPQAKTPYDDAANMSPWCNFPGTSGTKYFKITQDNIAAMLNQQKTPQQAFDDTVKDLNELIAEG